MFELIQLLSAQSLDLVVSFPANQRHQRVVAVRELFGGGLDTIILPQRASQTELRSIFELLLLIVHLLQTSRLGPRALVLHLCFLLVLGGIDETLHNDHENAHGDASVADATHRVVAQLGVVAQLYTIT